MLLQNSNGDELLNFIPYEKIALGNKPPYSPLTYSLAVIKYHSRYLFVFNRRKQKWELPGGIKEKNEHTRECCSREILEETNQIPVSLNFRGFMCFRLKPDNRIEYGALFSGQLDSLRPFRENEEIEKIIFWDLKENIGPVDEIDRNLVNFV
ncbi:MAG: NUDIX hydrolase [Spirochaetales bacterium]|nr:NUDIX hydrolase [Spirochaetales bacterium]